MIVSIWRNLWCLQAVKKSTSSLTFSLGYCKDIVQTCHFGNFGNASLHTYKVIPTTCTKLLFLSPGRKSISSCMIFWRYYKDMQTPYFGYFGHVWLLTTKMIVSTGHIPKINFIIYFFPEILHLKILQFNWLTTF